MALLPDTELAYIAGLLDGRAVFREREVGDTALLPVIAVNGGSPAVNEYLGKMTGTKITRTHRDYQRKPCHIHCREAHEHSVSSSQRWSVTGAKATIMLWNISGFLKIDKPKASALLQLGLTQSWKSNAVDDMEKLGWMIPDLKDQARARRTK